jgi:ribosome-binding protein aMBF1 (putative translation factor)
MWRSRPTITNGEWERDRMSEKENAARRLGVYVRQRREAQGGTIESISRELNWTTSKLRSVEMTRSTMLEPHELQQLATVLGVTTNDLLRVAGYLE